MRARCHSYSVNTQQLGVRWKGAQGWREAYRARATVSILGPAWMMSPPAAVESGVSHESSMNQPSLRGNKSGVSLTSFADLVQRHRLCLRCWNTGANAGNMQRGGGAFNYFLISRWGGKSRKKSQICRECSKAHNFDHCKIMAVIFIHR